jgi:hypothetical protein
MSSVHTGNKLSRKNVERTEGDYKLIIVIVDRRVSSSLTFHKCAVKQAQSTSISYTNVRRTFEIEFVADRRFELGVKDSAAEAELVLVVLH